MEHRKDTQNTYVYFQETDDGLPPVLERVYLPRWAMGSDPPKFITITISPEESE